MLAIILIRVLGATKCEGGSTPSTRLYATTLSNVVVMTTASAIHCYATAILLIRVLGAAKCEGGSTPSTRLYAITMCKLLC